MRRDLLKLSASSTKPLKISPCFPNPGVSQKGGTFKGALLQKRRNFKDPPSVDFLATERDAAAALTPGLRKCSNVKWQGGRTEWEVGPGPLVGGLDPKSPPPAATPIVRAQTCLRNQFFSATSSTGEWHTLFVIPNTQNLS